MSKTIERRLRDRSVALANYALGDATAFQEHDSIGDAIIEEWNAAVEALKAIADKSVYQLGDDIICEGCRKYASASDEIKHVSDCPVGALLKLIAKMEGTDV